MHSEFKFKNKTRSKEVEFHLLCRIDKPSTPEILEFRLYSEFKTFSLLYSKLPIFCVYLNYDKLLKKIKKMLSFVMENVWLSLYNFT